MKKLVPVVLVAALCVGCAESVLIRSVPPDAKVIIDNKDIGTTPVEYRTRDVRPFSYHIEREGFPAVDGA